MAKQRLTDFTSSLEDLMYKLTVQERNALFHDLHAVRAKYAKRINQNQNRKRVSADFGMACGTKRQATLFAGVTSASSLPSRSAATLHQKHLLDHESTDDRHPYHKTGLQFDNEKVRNGNEEEHEGRR